MNITLIQNYLKEIKSSLYEKSRNGDFVEVCSDMNIISTLPEYITARMILGNRLKCVLNLIE